MSKRDVIKKEFDHKADVERCIAYLSDLYQLPGCTRYTSEKITSFTCVKIIPLDNNAMLGSEQLMLDFQSMYFNKKKAFYINFQKHASIFVSQC